MHDGGLQAVDPLTVSHRLTAEGATDLPPLIAPESLFAAANRRPIRSIVKPTPW